MSSRKFSKSIKAGLVILAGLFSLETAAAAEAAKWEQAGWGGGGYYWAAAYHPTEDGVIYLGGDCAGIYKTVDHGRHWRMINSGILSYAVYSIAVDRTSPQTVYAATEEGLCKSTDAGEHWQVLPQTGKKELRITAERGKSVRSIAVDPSNGKNLYAASPGGKIYKSTDGGQSWVLSWEKSGAASDADVLRVQYGKINAQYFGDIAVPVAFPATAKAAECIGIGFTLKGDGTLPKDSFLMAKTSSGVSYRSKNLNTQYQDTNWRDLVLTANDFILDPDYAKAHPEAAAKPFTGPDWATINRLDLTISGNLPAESTVLKIRQFHFATGTVEKPVLASVRDFKTDKTLQFFGNIKLGAAPTGTIYSVAVSAKNPSLVIAGSQDSGMLLSKDAGKTWEELAAPQKAAGAAFDPVNPQIIYGAFFKEGIRKSIDGGKTWEAASEGIGKNVSMLEVVVSPANPLDLYAIGNIEWSGLFYYSNDGGKTWKSSSKLAVDSVANPTLDGITAGTAALSAPTNIAMNPKNPKELFLSANWRCPLSTDGGLTWTERDAGTDISCITDIRFLKGKAYVTVMDEGTLMSETNGKTWKQLWPLAHTPGLSGHNWRVAVDEVNGAERVLSTVSPWYKTPTSMVRSEDGGKTFKIISDGIPDYAMHKNTMWESGSPRALAVDPNDPQVIYMGHDGDPADGKTGGGIFKSTDGGVSWKQLANQPASRRMFYGLAVDPTDSKRIFWGACGTNGGVHRSTDGGETWQNVFQKENFVWNVLAAKDGTIYASGAQLYSSSDHGTTWKQLTHFPGQPSVVAIEVDPRDPKTIWCANTNWGSNAAGGVYKSTDSGATWQNITGDIPFVKPQLLRFNPATNELWAGFVGLYKIKQ